MNIPHPHNNKEIKKAAEFLASYAKYLTPLIFVIIIGLGFMLIILPRYREIEVKVSEVNEKKKTELESMKKDLDYLRKYKTAFDQLDEKKTDRINKMIPSAADGGYQTENLFAELEALVNSQGIILGSVSIQPDKKNGDAESGGETAGNTDNLRIKKTSLTVNVLSVDYADLKRLISIFENNLRLMDIQKVSYSPDQNSASLDLIVYYYK